MARREVQISGFGGQGIVLAGYILGKAATIYDGMEATLTQSYGPESRGGACSAQVVLADEPIHYPHLIQPQVLVAMSQQACSTYLPALAQDGILIVDEDLVDPPEVPPTVRVYRVPATRLAEEMGFGMCANIVMLGFLVGMTGLVSLDALREAVRTSVPGGTVEMNLKALAQGLEEARRAKECPPAPPQEAG
ncbi:MAG: 2-oxoacid:acceptor oxidoreductase family protein [Anaerolineae bacterium]